MGPTTFLLGQSCLVGLVNWLGFGQALPHSLWQIKHVVGPLKGGKRREEKEERKEKKEKVQSKNVEMIEKCGQKQYSIFLGYYHCPSAVSIFAWFYFFCKAMARNKNKQKNQKHGVSQSMPMAASVTTQNDNQNQTVEEDRESFTCAMRLVNASVLPLALKTVVDLGVLDVLSMADPDVGLTAAEIAERIPTRNPEAPGMLERILRLLMNEGVVYCSSVLFDEAPMTYRLGRVGKYFVRDENGVSLAPLMTLAHDKVYLETWTHLKDAILEGGTTFNRAHGTHLFDYSARDARFSQVYNTAMFNHTTLVFKKMLESYSGFENLKQVVDVGGGIGVALSLITFKYPFINAINFDLPHVIQHAPPFPGVKHVEGDMFKSVPKGDAIILKWILRDWDDEHCLKLLKNCYMSVPVNGKIIVVEQILPTFAEITAVSKDKSQLDMVSLTQTPGGKERMQGHLFNLAFSAGFKGVSLVSYVYHYWLMEFLK